ncbi:hypothetical protein PG991_012188 [Apiospora marii]|uniref:Zn(2)-C6 fungal-type domain-containing protein n=1 Tax=Apiospora marii TaxID=335849 RepID=A0ABR1R9W5_9PEZI
MPSSRVPAPAKHPPSPSASRPAKRRKVTVACQECRDKKTKCDSARPVCGPCARKRRPEAQCVYPDTPQQQSRVDMVELQLLRSEVQDLRQILNQTPSALAVGPNGGDPSSAAALPANTALRNGATAANGVQSSTMAIPVTPSPAPPPPATVPTSWNATPRTTPLPGSGDSRQSQEFGTPLSSGVGDSGTTRPQDTQGPGGFMGASETSPDEPGPVVFLGPSSAAQFMREVQDVSAKERRHSNYRAVNAAAASSSSSSMPASVAQRKALGLILEFLDAQVLPAPKTADSHLAKYWSYAQPLHPILHRPTFMKKYDYIFGKSEIQDGDTHGQSGFNTIHEARAFHVTLNLVFALGCTYHFASGGPVSFKENALVFFNRSQELLKDADLDHGSLSLVQAFLLTAHYLQSTDKINKCWLAAGTAIRLAQGIGIQLDMASESQAERQERRRTWWGCILMDRVLSMTYGRPPMVIWPTSVPLPESIDDALLLPEPGSCSQPLRECAKSEVAFFVQALKLSKDFGALTFILKIDANLARWRRQLPEHLIYRDDFAANSDPIQIRQSSSLHCRYLHQRILLFRPITIDLAQGAFLQPEGLRHLTDFQLSMLTGCIMACLRAAQELVNLLSKGNASQVPPWWYSIFYLYTAGTVLLAVLTSPTLRKVQTANIDELKETWARCMKGLARYDDYGSGFSRRCRHVLQKVYAERSGEQCSDVHQMTMKTPTPRPQIKLGNLKSRLPFLTTEASEMFGCLSAVTTG